MEGVKPLCFGQVSTDATRGIKPYAFSTDAALYSDLRPMNLLFILVAGKSF